MPHCHNLEVLLASRATAEVPTGHWAPTFKTEDFQALPIRNAELSICFASVLLPGDSALEDAGLEE